MIWTHIKPGTKPLLSWSSDIAREKLSYDAKKRIVSILTTTFYEQSHELQQAAFWGRNQQKILEKTFGDHMHNHALTLQAELLRSGDMSLKNLCNSLWVRKERIQHNTDPQLMQRFYRDLHRFTDNMKKNTAWSENIDYYNVRIKYRGI